MFSRMDVNLTDMDPIAQGVLESNDGVNRFSPIDASDDEYNGLALHEKTLSYRICRV